MTDVLHLGETTISLELKAVKHVQLSVHPPDGRVSLVAPLDTRLEVARAYAASKLRWIRAQQAKLEAQEREAPRQYIGRETHYVWGRRYLLQVVEQEVKPHVEFSHHKITLSIRPGSDVAKRDAVMQAWYRSLLHQYVPRLMAKWEAKLGVRASGYAVRRMKTRWGSCNPTARSILLNTELAKKPRELLEYVMVHELLHLIVPTHSPQFLALLDLHYPTWRDARAELNALPLADGKKAV